MNFRDAARFFDKDAVYDGYTSALLFYGHTTPHDDKSSSGATSRRRTLVTIPTTTAPARGVVLLFAERWLMGGSNPDPYEGANIRRSYDLKKATGLLSLYTPGAACLSTPSTTFYAHKMYYRDMTNPRTETDVDVMWNIFCPLSELVVKGSFLEDASGLMRVRNVYDTIEGYKVAETDQLDAGARQAITFIQNATRNLVTEAVTSVTTATNVIQMDMQKFYRFSTAADGEILVGDRVAFIAKSVITPKVGGTFTMLAKTWRIAKVMDEINAWAMQVRLA